MAAVTGAKNLAEGKSPARAMLGAGTTAMKEKVKNLFGKGNGKGGGGKKLKVTNIVESIDVGVPISLAYNQWTEFTDFPKFMKKVEDVEQAEDEKLNWKAQVLWSHRTWESTIQEQVPEDRIVWRSKGAKGYVDGAVTFHELAPNLTRILVVLEDHPQGFFEYTGNLWRAQGRRARLQLKHFRRHVMTEAVLHPDEIEGWRGVIHDGEVVQDHEAALEEEEQSRDESPDGRAEYGPEDEESPDGRGEYVPEDEEEESPDGRGEYASDEEESEEEEPLDDRDEYAAEDEEPEEAAAEDEEPEEPGEAEDEEPEQADDEDEDERPARTARASGRSSRGRRSAGTGRPRRSAGSSRTQDRPQRTVRRAGTRGGQGS
jgi:uncharacterized membrane protein